MSPALEQRLDAINAATLTPLVHRALGDAGAVLLGWYRRPLTGGLGGSPGVFRFWGKARLAGEIRDWSLVLKVLGPTTGSQHPRASNYWRREALVYQSGMLDYLTDGLVTPVCLDVVEQQDGTLWLWLEQIVEESDEVWTPARYGLAARHLGQFNGAYAAGTPLPDAPWLSSGPMAELMSLAEPGIAELPRLSQLPTFAELCTAESIERSLRLWEERRRFLAILDQLPRTLCHHDAFRLNLFSRTDSEGQVQTVVIDWAQAGVGTVGLDAVSLFTGSLRHVEIDIDWIPEFDAQIFDGYIAGLRDAGWEGDAQLVRFCFGAWVALSKIADRAIKWPRVAQRVAVLPAGAEPPRLLNPGGPTQAAAAYAHALHMGVEAQELLNSRGW